MSSALSFLVLMGEVGGEVGGPGEYAMAFMEEATDALEDELDLHLGEATAAFVDL